MIRLVLLYLDRLFQKYIYIVESRETTCMLLNHVEIILFVLDLNDDEGFRSVSFVEILTFVFVEIRGLPTKEQFPLGLDPPAMKILFGGLKNMSE